MADCEIIAKYMLTNKTTIRRAADYFGLGKSTVHYYVSKKLHSVNPSLYTEVKELLTANWNDRQHRGGVACKGIKRNNK